MFSLAEYDQFIKIPKKNQKIAKNAVFIFQRYKLCLKFDILV